MQVSGKSFTKYVQHTKVACCPLNFTCFFLNLILLILGTCQPQSNFIRFWEWNSPHKSPKQLFISNSRFDHGYWGQHFPVELFREKTQFLLVWRSVEWNLFALHQSRCKTVLCCLIWLGIPWKPFWNGSWSYPWRWRLILWAFRGSSWRYSGLQKKRFLLTLENLV